MYPTVQLVIFHGDDAGVDALRPRGTRVSTGLL